MRSEGNQTTSHSIQKGAKSMRTEVARMALARAFRSILAVCTLTLLVLVEVPIARAGGSDPASCDALMQKYFGTGVQGGSTSSFTLVSDNNFLNATYIEGTLTLNITQGWLRSEG